MCIILIYVRVAEDVASELTIHHNSDPSIDAPVSVPRQDPSLQLTNDNSLIINDNNTQMGMQPYLIVYNYLIKSNIYICYY